MKISNCSIFNRFRYTAFCMPMLCHFHRTFCDARGKLCQRFDRRHNGYVLSNQVQRDCFGRDVTSLKNVWIYGALPTSYYKSNAAIRVQTDYDILDRPIATHWADGAESFISYGIGDDAFGVSRLLQNRTDENGNEWQQYTSPQGWLTTSVAPDEATTTFRYDPLGQLLQSTDPDGLATTHTYDGFGRRTKRVHPDAGSTRWTYDAAGNRIASATQVQLNRGEQTTYEYDYNRPTHIHYSQYPQNDVYYTYDSVGRISMVRDATGTERMEYDAMGNISLSERTIGIPTENVAYFFRTRFTYDSFGRMRSITYPDGEVVNYGYENGLLRTIAGNASIPYVRDISYDLYGNVSYIQYGNGLQTNIFYDDVHLRPYNRQTYTGHDIPLQEISYTYDGVGNITRINQSVDKFSNMGGAYNVQYTYDDQYRLTRAVQNSTDLGGYDYSMGYSPSGLVATKNCSEIGANITYGYQYSSNNRISSFASHRVATLFPTNTEEVALTVWNANGELTSIVQPFQDNFRRHLWNEAGQLSLFVSNEYCGYYAYDAQGNRAYKLTGMVVADQYDAGSMQATAYFDDVTLYVNPYMVVTPRGYTKHYYNGSQRIAAQLGGAWRQDSTSVQSPQLIAQGESLWESVTNTEDLGEQNILSDDVYVGGSRQALPACQYGPQIAQLSGYHGDDMLSRVFSGRASERTLTDTIGIYFYHPDHLGSANWITNSQGQAVQYIHYMPYGEVWVNQQTSRYDERFKFTGKERDTETGYDYFGARYYSPMLGHWLSVDKLADDYPHITPYAQSAWNPIKNVDPNGKEVINKMNPKSQNREQRNLYAAALNFQDNPKQNQIFYIAHGNQERMYPVEQMNDGIDAQGFVDYIKNNSELWNVTEDKSCLSIVLLSCETGKGENSIAEQISKLLPEVSVIAPNEEVKAVTYGEPPTSIIYGVYKKDATTSQNLKDENSYGGQWIEFKGGNKLSQSEGASIKYVYKNED